MATRREPARACPSASTASASLCGRARLLLLLSVACWGHSAGALQVQSRAQGSASLWRPRVHVYDLPKHLVEPCTGWACQDLLGHLRNSPYHEPDPEKADVFWVNHVNPFSRSGDVTHAGLWAAEAWEYIRATWPYLNASLAANRTTHFIVLECDMGPGDCGYVQGEMRVDSLPYWWNPADPRRAVGHIMVHGMRDGPDAGFPSCRVCFQRGKDIFIPVEKHNACGPLCGFNLTTLRQHSQWGKPERLRTFQSRTNTFFFAGSIDVPNAVTDVNGRGQIWLAHHTRQGYQIVNTRGRTGPPLNFAEEMSKSVFCYSPLGGGTGPPDRYVASVLLGCIPVMLSNTFMEGRRTYELAMPLDDLIDWADIGVLVGLHNLSTLHETLDAISPAERARKQAALSKVWRKLLFTSLYGPYLSENGHRDAFHALMVSMARRAGLGGARGARLRE